MCFRNPRAGKSQGVPTVTKMTVVMVTKVKRGIPKEIIFGVYTFCPLSKRGKAEHWICRGIDTQHHHPRTPRDMTSLVGVCEAGNCPGFCCGAQESQQASRTTSGVHQPPVLQPGLLLTLPLLASPHGCPPPNLMD